MVRYELEHVYHFSESQIDDGGYVIKTSIDDAKMAALYQAVQPERDADGRRQRRAAEVLHARRRGAGGSGDRRRSRPCTRARAYPGSRQRDRTGHAPMTVKECSSAIHCEVNMAVVQPGAGRLLVQAVHPGHRGQAGDERADQHARRLHDLCIPPDSLPTTYPVTGTAVTRPPASCWMPVSCTGHQRRPGENGPYTPADRDGRSRSTPPTPTCGTWSAAPPTAERGDMAQSIGVDIKDLDSGLDK